MRFKAFVAAMLALFWLSLGTAPMAAVRSAPVGVQEAPRSSCGLAKPDQFWLCRALEDKNCNLTEGGSAAYWFCRGLVEKSCGLIAGDQYWFCHAVTTRNCGEVTGESYWMCRGLTEQNCGLVPGELYWMCSALQSSFRPEE